MSVLQVSLIAMVAVLLAIQLKGGRAEYGFLINLAAGIFLFFCIVGKLEVFIRAVEQIQSFLTLDTEYIAIMLKMVCITYIAQLVNRILSSTAIFNAPLINLWMQRIVPLASPLSSYKLR